MLSLIIVTIYIYIYEHIIKLTKMYLFWNAIYLPLAIYDYSFDGKSFLHDLLLYFRGFFIIGEHYNSWILWYLLSSIYSMILLMYLVKRHSSDKIIMIIACLFYVLSCFLDYVSDEWSEEVGIIGMAYKIVRIIGNGRLLRGFFFIPLGYVLYKQNYSKFVSFAVFLVSFTLMCIFNGLVDKVLICFAAVSLFIIVLNIQMNDSKIFGCLRNLSTYIYFLHLLLWTAVYMLLYGEKTYGMDMFLLTVSLSIVVSCMIIVVEKNKKKV